ncbi:MAG: hypothetical protein DI616_16015 [Paracoccus denitrificans]|uniref:Uncharacterized protein n=1 Tax=Paracoccus denitrificans TaxID=266 RepID=A0A533I3J6_PARDE|nr:MAG: hypothetical protein DI616_16015 [Paracoccus denitrificans]
MQHQEALSIRILTEAMVNAYSCNEHELQAALRDSILALVRPQAPEVVQAEEPAAAQPTAGISEEAQIDKEIREIVADNCPCCILKNLVINGEEPPYGAKRFMHSIARIGGYNALAETIQATMHGLMKAKKDLSSEQLVVFTKNLTQFTMNSMEVREELVELGLAPALSPDVADMGARLKTAALDMSKLGDLAPLVGKLREMLEQRGQRL